VAAPVRAPKPVRIKSGGPRAAPAVILALVVIVPLGLAVTIDRYGYDIWGAFVWGPVTLLLCLPLARWAARRTGEPGVVPFLLGAAFLKIVVGAVLRYTSAQAFYGGLADAASYDNAGSVLMDQFRQGIFTDLGKISGTRFIEVLSGLVQALIGETRMGNFLVFSFLGFIGMVLFYVAFCEALPRGDKRLYRWLLFLTPTMWYWPSSIGKEAFMLLCLGAAAFGAARLFGGHLSGVVIGGLGLWGTIVMRPHMTMVFMVGLLFALPSLTRRNEATGRRWVARLAPLLLLVLLPSAVGAVEEFFGLDKLDADTAEEITTEVMRRTAQGGSEYATADPFTPAGMVVGTGTVLLRPFPWEARGVQGLVSAAEIAVLAVVAGATLWRRRSGLLEAFRRRYVRLAIGYVLAFGSAFAAVGNFGILVRQRSLLLPLAFVIVASTRVAERRPTVVRR
jgi:hypothetical protein